MPWRGELSHAATDVVDEGEDVRVRMVTERPYASVASRRRTVGRIPP